MFTSKSKLTLRAVSFPFRESSRSLFTRRKVLGYVLPASQIECWPAARQTFWVAVPLEPKAPLSKDQLKLEWPVVSMLTGVQPDMARAGLLGRTQRKSEYSLWNSQIDPSYHLVAGCCARQNQKLDCNTERAPVPVGLSLRPCPSQDRPPRAKRSVRARCSWVCRATCAGWIAIRVRCLCQIC